MFFIKASRVFRATVRQKIMTDNGWGCELETIDQFVVKFGDKFALVEYLGNYSSYKELAAYVGKDGKVKELGKCFLSMNECNAKGEYIKDIKPHYFNQKYASNRGLLKMQSYFDGLRPQKQAEVTPIELLSEKASSPEYMYAKTSSANVMTASYNQDNIQNALGK